MENLLLSVRPNRPNHWAWDLRDGRDGSWFESMFEFDSPERARRSGLSRIAELQRSLQAPQHAPPADTGKARLVIVSADDTELFGTLKRLLADGQRVEIIPERRKSLAPMDRRSNERRSVPVSAAARARGWWIVPRDSAQTG